MKNRLHFAPLLALALAFPLTTLAQEGSVSISAPADGTKLQAAADNRVTYEIVPGPKGDHSHLYVDGKEIAVLRELKGSAPIKTLAAGPHEVCVKVTVE